LSSITSSAHCRLERALDYQYTCDRPPSFRSTRLYVHPHHLTRADKRTDPDLLKLNFVGRPLYQLAVCNYKVCACLGYRRLFERTNGVKYMGWIAAFVNYFIFVIIISHLATTLVIIFQCRPVEKSWKPWIEGHCLANYPTWNVRVALYHIRVSMLTFSRPLHLSQSCATSSPSLSRSLCLSACRWIPAIRST
jgi:hypothetical protein